MVKRLILAAIVILGFSGSAFASHCPAEIKKINAALAGASLHSSQVKTIKTLRDMGGRLHKARKHKDSLKALFHAKEILRQMGVAVK